jgi:hypothetical protein
MVSVAAGVVGVRAGDGGALASSAVVAAGVVAGMVCVAATRGHISRSTGRLAQAASKHSAPDASQIRDLRAGGRCNSTGEGKIGARSATGAGWTWVAEPSDASGAVAGAVGGGDAGLAAVVEAGRI